MSEVRASQTGEVTLPRWAGGPDELRYVALSNGLEYEEIARKKGWFTETVLFRVRGPLSLVKAYMRAVQKAVEGR